MSNKPNESIDEALVLAYLNERSVFLREEYLDLLAARTTVENFQMVLAVMKADPDTTELDVSLYINEIAKPEFQEFLPLIADLRKSFKDPDSLEDLDEAEAKIRSED